MTAAYNEAIEFITETLDELAEARALWEADAPPPGPCFEKLNEARTALQQAVGVITVLMGEANRLSVEKAQARGERNCAVCFLWRPEAEMEHHVIEAVSGKAKESGRTSSWWTCKENCR